MPFIEWERSFELGIEKFDDDHRHLVGLINKIYDDYTTEAPSEEVGVVLEELINYTCYHFGAEELWMEKQNYPYPKIDRHFEEHDKFRHTLTELKKDYSQGKLNISLDALIFLKNWLTDHILKTDSEYGLFVASRGVAIDPK